MQLHSSLQAKLPNKIQAAKVLAKRRLVRSSFAEWCRHKGYRPAKHHQLIIDEITAFLKDPELEVLLLFAPPGSAKSTYISVLLCEWYLANNPSHLLLAATHNNDLAEDWGRRVRNDIELDQIMLGIEVAGDNRSAAKWGVTKGGLDLGGSYYGVGANVGISGRRADLGIIDDLFGSRKDAFSPVVRKHRWDWYINDFGGRLKPGAKRIIMNTRWHEDDVAGRVLAQIEQGVIKGKVVTLRALAEADDPLGRPVGTYLWDDDPHYKYGNFLRQRHRETDAMMWSALYQQRPTPEEGDYFKAGWFHPCDALPPKETLRFYGASDYAVTAEGGDYTVHVVVGLDPQDDMYLADLWREQTTSDRWIEAWCDMVLRWNPMGWGEESGQILSSVGPYLLKRQRERKAYVYREQFPSRADKGVRARSIQARLASRGMYVMESAPYWEPLRAELLGFPAGKNDDQADALSLVGQLLDRMLKGKPAEEERPEPQHTMVASHGVSPEGRHIIAKTTLNFNQLRDRQAELKKRRERGY